MGYRSDVMVLIYPDAEKPEDERTLYEQLKTLMGTMFKDIADYWKDPHIEWKDTDCVLQFTISDVKWYPSYPEVIRFCDMLEAFKGYDDADIKGYCTEFVRIGEESDDIEEAHTGDNNQYYLQVRRSIECNV